MKRRIFVAILALLLPVLVFAQAPPPTPAPAPPAGSGYKIRPSEAPPSAVFAEEPQEPFARQQAQPGQPGMPPGQMDLGKWWKNSDIAEALQLTEAQITQIEQTFFEHRLKLIDLHAEVERQEARLQPLIEADRPDEAKVGAQIDLLLAARGKLEKENAMMMLAIRRVLSVEQWKKLEAIQQGRERMRGSPYTPMHPKMRSPMPAPPASTPPPTKPPDGDGL
jgi:protein CpxP